jgi:transposase-like protein
MARPLSLDLRERVTAQVARDMTRKETAALNGIVSSTVTKWWKRALQIGSRAAA